MVQDPLACVDPAQSPSDRVGGWSPGFGGTLRPAGRVHSEEEDDDAISGRKKNGLPEGKPLIILVPQDGVEPPTFALRMRCSTN